MNRVVENDALDNVRVFISYCHESAAHDSAVQTLAYHLARDGLDCVFDQQHTHEPSGGWMLWMVKHLHAAHFVLVVCSQTYDQCAQGEDTPEGRREARFDPVITYAYLAFEEAVRAKCLPVVFSEAALAFIPGPLKSLQAFNMGTKSGFAALHRALTDRPPKENPYPGTTRAYLSEPLWSELYPILRDMAHKTCLRWQDEETLDATALVHETYLRLVENNQLNPENRTHFLRLAAQAMRRILVDQARQRKTKKHGGDLQRVAFEEAMNITEEDADALIGLDAALQKLALINPRRAEVVVCRYFGRMTIAETAAVLYLALRTVEREWQAARAWLHRELRGDNPDTDA